MQDLTQQHCPGQPQLLHPPQWLAQQLAPLHAEAAKAEAAVHEIRWAGPARRPVQLQCCDASFQVQQPQLPSAPAGTGLTSSRRPLASAQICGIGVQRSQPGRQTLFRQWYHQLKVATAPAQLSDTAMSVQRPRMHAGILWRYTNDRHSICSSMRCWITCRGDLGLPQSSCLDAAHGEHAEADCRCRKWQLPASRPRHCTAAWALHMTAADKTKECLLVD